MRKKCNFPGVYLKASRLPFIDRFLRGVMIMVIFFVVQVFNFETYASEFQQVVVSGTVTDNMGAPLPGVTVTVKGKAVGILTDIAGKYTLTNLSPDAILQFSFVGMGEQEIPINGREA